jgi:beta-glucosidase
MDCLEQVVFKATGKSGIVWPSTVVMTSTWNADDIAKRSSLTANEAYFMGCTEIWSGGPNIHRTPFNGRASAYYSEDGSIGYLVGTIVAKNVQKYGIILGLKHMVVNDQEAHRESVATFTNEQALREEYLRAFEGAFSKGGALGTMTAFNRIGCTYCGSSTALLTQVLRNEWGFKGHVTTDAVVGTDYKTHYTSSLTAGVDYYCWDMGSFAPPGTKSTTKSLVSKDVIKTTIENGDGYMLQKLREATKHTVYAQSRSILTNGLSNNTQIEYITPWWQILLKALNVTFAVLTAAFVILYYLSMCIWGKKKQGGIA